MPRLTLTSSAGDVWGLAFPPVDQSAVPSSPLFVSHLATIWPLSIVVRLIPLAAAPLHADLAVAKLDPSVATVEHGDLFMADLARWRRHTPTPERGCLSDSGSATDQARLGGSGSTCVVVVAAAAARPGGGMSIVRAPADGLDSGP